jgi:hypothetical protein
MITTPIKVYYWTGFTGRAEPILFLLEQASAKYSIEWKDGPIENQDPVSFAYPIIDDGEQIISQTAAILFYLSKKLGIVCEGNEGKILQVSLNIADIWAEAYQARSGEDAGAEFISGRLSKWFDNVNASIKGKYFFGDHVSFVDFQALNVFNVLDFMYGEKVAHLLKGYPKITTWLSQTKSLPSVQAVLNKNIPVLYPSVQAK